MSNRRPPHERSKHLNDTEMNILITLIERESGVVSFKK